MRDSLRQPAWHVIVLCILTCMAYPYYWCYKTWRDLGQKAAASTPGDNPALDAFRDINPLVRTLLLLIPLTLSMAGSLDPMLGFFLLIFPAINLFLVLTLVKGVAELHPDPASFPRQHPLVAAGGIMVAILACFSLALLPPPFFLFSFLLAIPLAVVQSWLNKYWQAVEPEDMSVRFAFSIGELLAILIGGSLLGLVAAGLMIKH